jgi:hypothetical protein
LTLPGWACLGCHATTPFTGEAFDVTLGAWMKAHAEHGAWVNHPDYCGVKAGGTCTCGRETT